MDVEENKMFVGEVKGSATTSCLKAQSRPVPFQYSTITEVGQLACIFCSTIHSLLWLAYEVYLPLALVLGNGGVRKNREDIGVGFQHAAEEWGKVREQIQVADAAQGYPV